MVLGRSIFCEKSLLNAIKFGCNNYFIFASGYDTFAYRNNFKNSLINYFNDEISFSSFLGISFYLAKSEFFNIIKFISQNIKKEVL